MERQLRAIDMHSHYASEKGYLWKTPQEVAAGESSFRYQANYKSDEEMAADFRKAGVGVILDLGFTLYKTVEEARDLHDYVGGLIRTYSDVVLGGWVSLDPRRGLKALRELERCLKDLGMTGFATNPASLGLAPSDRAFYPFYELCIEMRAPVLIAVGYTVMGAGLPGGGGRCLDYCRPMYVDEVAATFPDLTIIAGRQAWPWVSEMIAVLLHKPNVWNELHGWSPKYFTEEFKRDIPRRLQDKIMFGADYPMLGYDRLFRDWEALGYSQDVMEKIYRGNAQRVFRQLGRPIKM